MSDAVVDVSVAKGKCQPPPTRGNRMVQGFLVSVQGPDNLTVRFKNPYDGNRQSIRPFYQRGHCLNGATNLWIFINAPPPGQREPFIVGARRT